MPQSGTFVGAGEDDLMPAAAAFMEAAKAFGEKVNPGSPDPDMQALHFAIGAIIRRAAGGGMTDGRICTALANSVAGFVIQTQNPQAAHADLSIRSASIANTMLAKLDNPQGTA